MSILDIKARFSRRILEAEKEEEIVEGIGTIRRRAQSSPTDLKEVDVGIKSYVSDLPGFLAVIKQRYSDFNVHEIDNDGNKVVLDSYEVPDEAVQKLDPPPCFGEEVLANLEKIVNGSDETVKSVTIDVTDLNKDDRKNIHQFIKGKYGNLSTETNVGEEKSILTIKKSDKGVKDDRYPSHMPRFLHFTLNKANMDTTEALNILGTKLRLKAKHFAICGTKDKRAKTSQRVSVKHLFASKLDKVNSSLRRMNVGNYEYKDFSLRLGALKGNNFQIALRSVAVPDEEIDNAFNKLNERGFINYFGLQRFGKCAESPSSEIGLQIIREAYGAAVGLILKPRNNLEPADVKQAREIWARTKNAGQAFSALRAKDRTIEGKLLYGLKTHGPAAFANALDLIPRNLRLLYLHAYQSLVWNKLVSRRVDKYGLKVLEGDLVLEDESVENDIANDSEEESNDEAKKDEKNAPTVKILKPEDLKSYEIYDIVMPLPGMSSVYPQNEIGEWYPEVLAEDKLTIDSFSSRARQYSLKGSYRKMIQLPKNMTWKIMRYANAQDDLILSDTDIMQGKKLPEIPDGPHKAVVVSFDLSPSTYATMALREVLRADTSASSQTALHELSLKRPNDGQDGTVIKKRKEEDS